MALNSRLARANKAAVATAVAAGIIGATPVGSILPALLVAPSVSVVGGGALTAGCVLTTDDGQWTNSPIDFYRSWDRRLAGTSNAWVRIDYFDKNYTTRDSDVGYEFRCRVAAVNLFGMALVQAVSNTLGAIIAAAVENARSLVPYDTARSVNAGNLTVNQAIDVELQNQTGAWVVSATNLPPGMAVVDAATAGRKKLTGTPTQRGAYKTTFTQSQSGKADFTSTWWFLVDTVEYASVVDFNIQAGVSTDTGAGITSYNESGRTSKALTKQVGGTGYRMALFDDGVGWSGDPAADNRYRSEIEFLDRFARGETYRFADTFMIETSRAIPPLVYDAATGYIIIWQGPHHIPPTGSSFVSPCMPIEIRQNADGLPCFTVTRRSATKKNPTNAELNDVNVCRIPIDLSVPHFYECELKMDPTGADSRLLLKLDGVIVADLANIPFGYSDDDEKDTDGVSPPKRYYCKAGVYMSPKLLAGGYMLAYHDAILGRSPLANVGPIKVTGPSLKALSPTTDILNPKVGDVITVDPGLWIGADTITTDLVDETSTSLATPDRRWLVTDRYANKKARPVVTAKRGSKTVQATGALLTKAVDANFLLLNDFTSITTTTSQQVASLEQDTTRKLGPNPQAVIQGNPTNNTAKVVFAQTKNADMSLYDGLHFSLDIQSHRNVNTVTISIVDASTGTGYGYNATADKGTDISIGNGRMEGRYNFYVPFSEFGTTLPTGAKDWKVQIEITGNAPYAPRVGLAAVAVAKKPLGILAHTVDDCQPEWIDAVGQICRDAGVGFHMNIEPDAMSPDPAVRKSGRVSLNDLLAWKDVVSCGPDGTSDTSSMTLKATLADLDTNFASVQQWLIDKGLVSEGNKLGDYPNGKSWGETTIVSNAEQDNKPGLTQITSITTDGTNLVTVPDSTLLSVGDIMVGAGFKATPTDGRVTVTEIVDATHVRVSRTVASRTAYAAAFVHLPGRFYLGAIPAMLRGKGIKVFRNTTGYQAGRNSIRLGLGDQDMEFTGKSLVGLNDDATGDAAVDTILADCEKGGVIMTYAHGLLTGSATGTIHSQRSAGIKFIQKAIALHQAGRITMMNGSQLVTHLANQGVPVPLRVA